MAPSKTSPAARARLAAPELFAEAKGIELDERRRSLELRAIRLDVSRDGAEGIRETVRALREGVVTRLVGSRA